MAVSDLDRNDFPLHLSVNITKCAHVNCPLMFSNFADKLQKIIVVP